MNTICNDEEIIGYVADIRAEAKAWMDNNPEEVEITLELIRDLEGYEFDELVKCIYHPMGAWRVVRLVEEACAL